MKKQTNLKAVPDINHPTLGVEQFTDLTMRPFDAFLPDGTRIISHEYAEELAYSIVDYAMEGEDNKHAALINLIAGLAAIENHEDRQMLAARLIEVVFSKTPAANKALRGYMKQWKGKV